MISSFGTSVALLALVRGGASISTHAALLITVAVTTVCWLLAAYLAPETDRDVLKAFYRKVRPFGPGWATIRAEAGPLERAKQRENIPHGAARVGCRQHGDLVGAVRGRELICTAGRDTPSG